MLTVAFVEGDEFEELLSTPGVVEETDPGVEAVEASSEGGSDRGRGGGADNSIVASIDGSSSRIHALSFNR